MLHFPFSCVFVTDSPGTLVPMDVDLFAPVTTSPLTDIDNDDEVPMGTMAVPPGIEVDSATHSTRSSSRIASVAPSVPRPPKGPSKPKLSPAERAALKEQKA